MAFIDAAEQLILMRGNVKLPKKTSKVVQIVAAKTVDGALLLSPVSGGSSRRTDPSQDECAAAFSVANHSDKKNSAYLAALRMFLALKNSTTRTSAQPSAATAIVTTKPPPNKTAAPST
jgi:hypothetical protein